MNVSKVKQLMKEKEITQYRLAKMTGISEAQVSRLLHGKRTDPKISAVKAIAAALEVEISEII